MNIETIRRFRGIMRKFEQIVAKQTKACCSNVTLAQCHTLLEVEAQGETTTVQLAKALRLDKSTVSLTIDSLVKRGLIRRRLNSLDRRITLLTLTDRGKTTCDEINKANDEYYASVLARLPETNHGEMIDLFKRFVQALAEHEAGHNTPQRCCGHAQS